MKKFMLALFLCAGICTAGFKADAFASEPAVREKDADIQKEYMDLSGSIIQEGGFPAEQPSSGRRAGRLAAASNEREVQNALTGAWDSFADNCDLSAYNIPKEQFGTIYHETINTHPEYFYVSGEVSYYYNAGNNCVTDVKIKYNTDKATASRQMAEYNGAVADVVRNADASWSDMEKALYVNDYLARNCAYDETYQKYSAYNALVEGTAVCQGYALAFLDLTRELGLSCEIVTSDSIKHAWNIVKIGESYYHVDVTWNDPVNDLPGRARHVYFMKSTSYFKSDDGGRTHSGAADWVMTGSITESAASDTAYDIYFWDSVNAGFDYIEDAWYGFNGKDGIFQYHCDGAQFTEEGQIVNVSDEWPVIGESGFWVGSFIGTGSYNGKYYYSASTSVYHLDVQTKKSTEFFRLSEEQKQTGRIYGMNITASGELKYVLAASPNEPGTAHTASQLETVEKKNLYRIHFDGNGADSGSMNDTTWIVSGEPCKLDSSQFIRDGYSFESWNTKPDGSGETYADQAYVARQASRNGEKITLYAQWVKCTHGKTEIRSAVEASCSREGYTGDTYCLECGDLISKGESFERLPHTLVKDEAVEATCTEDGKTEGSHCNVCGSVVVSSQTVPAKGHSWEEDYTVDRPATETEDGQESIHCSRCDAIKDIRVLPATGESHEHDPVVTAATEATCTTPGKTEGIRCRTCGFAIKEQEVIPAKKHDWNTDYTVDTEPTTEREGQESIHCSRCDAIKDIRVIPKLDEEEREQTDLSDCSLTLEEDSYVYDGREKRPAVTVEYSGTVLSTGDYDVRYSGNIHPGTALVTVIGKGDYKGTLQEKFEIVKAPNSIQATQKYTKTSKTKAQTFGLNARALGGTLTWQSDNSKVRVDQNGKVTVAGNFVGVAIITVKAGNRDYAEAVKKVTVTVNPSKVTLLKVRKSGKTKAAVRWKKSPQGTAYQIQYAAKRSFSGAKSKIVKGASKTGRTLTGLKKKKTYYVRIRTYKAVSGKKYYSSWSSVKQVKM